MRLQSLSATLVGLALLITRTVLPAFGQEGATQRFSLSSSDGTASGTSNNAVLKFPTNGAPTSRRRGGAARAY